MYKQWLVTACNFGPQIPTRFEWEKGGMTLAISMKSYQDIVFDFYMHACSSNLCLEREHVVTQCTLPSLLNQAIVTESKLALLPGTKLHGAR